MLQGHPDSKRTPGVGIYTGSQGQGLGAASGGNGSGARAGGGAGFDGSPVTTADQTGADEALLARLDDLLERVRRTAARVPESDPVAAERARVLGWLSFYERDLVPEHWHLLQPDERAAIIDGIRRVRIVIDTGASRDDVNETFARLNQILFGSGAGLLMTARRMAVVEGVPERSRAALGEASARAAAEFGSRDGAGYRAAKAALEAAMEEANRGWQAWAETAGVRVASPDLVVSGPHERE
jgi:hypothetical protein